MTETDLMPNPVAVDSEHATVSRRRGRVYGNRNPNRRRTELPRVQFVGDHLPGPKFDVFSMRYIIYYCVHPISAMLGNLICIFLSTISRNNDGLH